MAVIDTSMDMPKSCEVCPYHKGENIHCLKGCFIPWGACDNDSYIHKNCPLKEVPSGKWEHIAYYDGGYGINETCSNCGHTIHGQIFDLVDKFCPNCGAKMVEEQTGENT